MTNQEIAELFRRVAAVYSLQNIEPFRTQAYLSAAASIEQFAAPLKEMWEAEKLEEVPGIGQKFCTYLDELFRTGTVERLVKILKSEPAGMYPLLDISGIGPKTAYKLAHTFHLNNTETAVEEVHEAAQAGKIRTLPGFSEVSEQKILQAIEQHLKQKEHRILLNEAQVVAEDVLSYIRRSDLHLKSEVLGSLRRHVPTVGGIDIAVATGKPQEFMDYLLKFPHIRKIISSGPKTTSFVHTSGLQIDVKTQFSIQWGSMLQHYTGSKLHNIHLRTLAKEKGMSLSENGILENEKLRQFDDEAEFYTALGLDFIPPELREDQGEIEAARTHQLPKLVELKDIRGDLHIHTNLTFPSSHDSGENSIAEILELAEKKGYEFIGFSDHNPKQAGLSAAERLAVVKKRNQRIDEEVEKYHQHHSKMPLVLKGLEVDILPNGELALENEALELLDYAIVSLHSQFQLSREAMTKRVLKGLAHPKAKIFGHPTGRIIEYRPEIECDWQEVFTYCAQHGKFLEINSSPQRLDLPPPLIKEAIRAGASCIINTDSHHLSNLEFMQYGIWMAKRGWAEAKHIVNTWPTKEVIRRLKE